MVTATIWKPGMLKAFKKLPHYQYLCDCPYDTLWLQILGLTPATQIPAEIETTSALSSYKVIL